jgi:MFS family permease
MSIPTASTERTESAEQQPGVASFRRVLKNRNFLLLWCAQLISLTILNATNFAIVAHVTDQTHSALMSGLAIISFTLPAVPFSALAGVIVDRLDKRLVLWVSNILRMVTVLVMVLSLLIAPSNVWPLLGLSFIASLIGQFFIPAEGASIPLLVGERELMPALSLFNISLTVSQAIGFLLFGRIITALFPPFSINLGTLTITVQPLDMVFVVVAVLYAVCALLILLIPERAFREERNFKRKDESAPVEVGRALENLWRDMVEGWSIVRKDRLLFFSVIQLSVVGIVMLLIGELAGRFVQEFLHRPAEDMSIIMAPAGVGLVGASILMPRITERVGKIRLTVIGFIALAGGFLLLPVCQWLANFFDPEHGAESPFLLWSMVLLVFVLGVAMAAVNIPTQTMMQQLAPETGRARVLSLQFMIYNTGSIPILLFAGIIAHYLGLTLLIVLVTASLLLFCWWGVNYIKKRDAPGKRPQREGEEEPQPVPESSKN